MSFDISALKVGDKVYIWHSNYGSGWNREDTVSKVTPSGRIVVGDGTVFDPNGRQRGSAGYFFERIVEPTERVIESARKRKVTEQLRPLLRKWEEWPVETMETVANLLERFKSDD